MGGVSTSHARLAATASRRSFPPAVRPVSAMSSPVSIIDRTLISYSSNVAQAISRHSPGRHALLAQRFADCSFGGALDVQLAVHVALHVDVDNDAAHSGPRLLRREDDLSAPQVG